jgi:hypothetical protein
MRPANNTFAMQWIERMPPKALSVGSQDAAAYDAFDGNEA